MSPVQNSLSCNEKMSLLTFSHIDTSTSLDDITKQAVTLTPY